MPQTEAQTRAIHDHAANLVVVAGAGSGKTYVLVERYLALLESNPAWPLSSLVAITFTQKAAGEMRDRVRIHLQNRAADGDAIWAQRMAAMDSARIDTIHGLCTAILRGNAAEAGVDPGFEVLDEIEAAALLDDTLDDVFRLLVADDSALGLFAEYGERVVRETLKGLIRAEIQPFSDDLLTEWLTQWVDEAHVLAAAYFQEVYAVERFAPVGGDVLSLGWETCGALIDWLSGQTERYKLADALDAIERIAGLKLPGVVAAAWGADGAAAKATFKAIRDGAKNTLADIGEPPGAADERAAHLLRLWALLANRVRDAYRAAKDDRAALDFDDLETLTRDLLRDESVRARYRGEFNHLLVDEFQDTNAAQWDIVRALTSHEQADSVLAGRLFVVGDPKQSIYGFRGADVSVFEQVRREIGQQVDLDRSFRTHRGLVDCLNSVFARLLVRDPHSPAAAYQVEFAAMEAERLDAPCDDPALELLLLDVGKLPEEKEDQAARRWEARAVARRIRQLVTEGRPIYDKKRGITRAMGYGDAALLFQAMTHVTLYEAALKAEGIPYLTVAGKGYYDRQEVWDLLNLLRALYSPADNLALAAALRSPLFSLSDDALLALRIAKGGSLTLWDALDRPEGVPADEAEAVTFARDVLYDLHRKAGRVTVADLLRRALDATGYLATLAGLPDGKRRRGNVEKLIDKAETSGRLTLSAFTQYLTELSASEVREGEASLENEGAVQLMSVHGSKGLEFPLVALVDSQHERGGGFDGVVKGTGCKVYDETKGGFVETYAYRRAAQLERGRDDAERRRLLYVAATRAQDHLLVSGQVKVSEKDGTTAAKGWLGQWIDALELGEIEPQGTQAVTYDWGAARIDFPEWNEGDEARAEFPVRDWDQPFASERPLLMGDVKKRTPLRSLTASQLADLGSALLGGKDAPYFAERWRRSAYHDAPARIEQVVRAAPKNVGEIVHQALRWPLPESEAALETTLRRFAWEEGIVDEAENREAVKRAHHLLTQVRGSDVFRALEQARAVYRQVPFVYSAGQGRSVHGVIDLLAQGADERWRVIDFKTNWLGTVTDAALAQDARRYQLQMAIYAAAVRELVGDAPMVFIHYIRYARTVMIAQNDWQTALARLDDSIELSGGDG